MADVARMDKVWRQHSDAFGEYMGKHAREASVKELEARIQALTQARDALLSAPVQKVSRKEYKSAERLC